MASSYERRERTFIRTEYVIRSGSVWQELRAALDAIHRELGEAAARWDTAATVESRDDEIVIWHEREVTE
ncbi:hypothetical protein [Spirillospora sp. NBC_01491]|uniref:hypothetical protein n=1 Tax=Spirillospora sp. NBC_01491 TaxID=2976007 RepID=UPI002E321FB0|nr:hypothetical protein [Spirillospora sp. NBC_01491]